MWTFGHLLVTQLIIVNTFHLALFVQYWTWPMFWSMFLSVLLFFICALLYNGFVTANWTWTNVKDPPAMVSLKSFSSLQFWMVSSTLTCISQSRHSGSDNRSGALLDSQIRDHRRCQHRQSINNSPHTTRCRGRN